MLISDLPGRTGRLAIKPSTESAGVPNHERSVIWVLDRDGVLKSALRTALSALSRVGNAPFEQQLALEAALSHINNPKN